MYFPSQLPFGHAHDCRLVDFLQKPCCYPGSRSPRQKTEDSEPTPAHHWTIPAARHLLQWPSEEAGEFRSITVTATLSSYQNYRNSPITVPAFRQVRHALRARLHHLQEEQPSNCDLSLSPPVLCPCIPAHATVSLEEGWLH